MTDVGFSLRALVTEVAATSDSPDPMVIVKEVDRRISETQRDAALWQALPVYVQNHPSNSTEPVHMFKAARLALGLDEEQATDLFHQYNDTDKLWELAEKYTNGRISRKEKV